MKHIFIDYGFYLFLQKIYKAVKEYSQNACFQIIKNNTKLLHQLNLKKITYNNIMILVIIILGLFFRVFQKEQSTLWTDEFATYWVSHTSTLSESISRATVTQGQSPFYYILVWGVLKVIPESEFALRLISLISSIVSIYLIYIISRQLFQKRVLENRNDSTTSPTPSLFNIPAIFATLLFSLDTTQIYYAQESRPYALAVMFALLSQFYFLKMIAFEGSNNNQDSTGSIYNAILLFFKEQKMTIFLYILSSSLICYTHYIFGTMILIQNILVAIILLTKNKKYNITLPAWCAMQIIIISTLLPLIYHLYPILTKSSKWTWLKSGGIIDTITIFSTMFNGRIIVMFASVFIILFTIDYFSKKKSIINFSTDNLKKNINNKEPCSKQRGMNMIQIIATRCKLIGIKPTCGIKLPNLKYRDLTILLSIWFITPPLFAYFATLILRISLLDTRYMTLSLIPFYLLLALCINCLSSKNIKIFLSAFILFAYIGGVLIPTYKAEGRFSTRISHDWRTAIKVLNKNLQKDDIIILRSGFVKENWIPYTKNLIVKEYVQAPLKSFYFDKNIIKDKQITLFNMTYMREREFYPYFDSVFSFAEEKQRIWIIGVNPPNTNYKISQVSEILRNSHKKAFEKDFSGVYLLLMKKRPDVYKMFNKKRLN